MQTRESDLKVRNSDLEVELAVARVTLEAAKREGAFKLETMEAILGNAILCARAEIMLEH